MFRHFWRACTTGRQSGLTMVELLVTIIIAGIAFAAIVPVFVQALETGQGDRARSLALSVAQDRIEKIRELGYEELTATNLSDPTFHFGLFGTSTTGVNGTTDKEFTVAYAVEGEQVSETDTRVAYKKVTVTVSWATPPSPNNRVSLTTSVYRQSAGPRVIDATLDETKLDASTKTEIAITPIRVSYYVDEADLVGMEPKTYGVAPNQHTVQGRVEISVSPGETYTVPYGAPSFSADQPAGTVGRTNNEFYVFWSPPGATAGVGVGDGYYSFSARAFSALGYVGEASSLIGSMKVETGPPPAVTDLVGSGTGTTGMDDGVVNLLWTASIATDLNHYTVSRVNPDGTVVQIAGGVSEWKETGWTDSGLTVGETYTYRVVAVDWVGKESDVAEVDVSVGDSTTPIPSAPTNLQADLSGTSVALTWVVSPSSTVAGYHVYVSDGTTSSLVGAVASGQPMTLSYDQGAGTTRYYTVKAYSDLSGDSAAASVAAGYPTGTVGTETWARVETPSVVDYNISARVTSVPNPYVKLKNLQLWYLGPSGTSAAVQIGSTKVTTATAPVFTVTDGAWNGQPAGYYEFRWYWVKNNGNASGLTKKLFSCAGASGPATANVVTIP